MAYKNPLEEPIGTHCATLNLSRFGGGYIMKAFDPATLRPNNPLRFCEPVGESPERRREMIAEAAYFRAQLRDFSPGHEVEDWLAAEAEVDLRLARRLADPAY